MLRGLVRRSPDLQCFGPDVVPWLYPLKALVQKKSDDNWTPLHQSFTRVIATGDIWTADRLERAGFIEGDKCRACGALASAHHRGWSCPARFWFRQNYGFENFLSDACKKGRIVIPYGRALLSPILLGVCLLLL